MGFEIFVGFGFFRDFYSVCAITCIPSSLINMMILFLISFKKNVYPCYYTYTLRYFGGLKYAGQFSIVSAMSLVLSLVLLFAHAERFSVVIREYERFSLNWPSWPDQFSSCDVRPYVCMFVCPLPMKIIW